jgi:hypothetical protein
MFDHVLLDVLNRKETMRFCRGSGHPEPSIG